MPNSGDSNISASADILSQLTNSESKTTNQNSEIDLLKSIDKTLHDLLQNGKGVSQSNAQNQMPGNKRSAHSYFQEHAKGTHGRGSFGSSAKGFFDELTDGMESVLIDELVGKEFKQQIRGIRDKFARDLGVAIDDLPSELGKAFGKQLVGKIKDTSLGQSISGGIENLKQQGLDHLKNLYTSGRDAYLNKNPMSGQAQSQSNISNIIKDELTSGVSDAVAGGLSSALGAGATGVGAGAAGAGATLAGLSNVAASVLPPLIGVAGGLVILDTVGSALIKKIKYDWGPAVDGATALIEQMKISADRYNQSQAKNLDYAQDRLAADVEVMVKKPFEILEQAAQSLYDAWDNNLRVINATQGYNKDDLQTLIGNFAERLREENLSRVVSASDITNNLSTVLESGLSGVVAEEFAYLATKLNAAVPTQDFFGYAGTYASIAANAIQQGKSEAEAIAYANKQLEAFASNILYASREISGGFTTGLRDASSIFEQSVQIAQASKTNDAVGISGVMTAVSAIVGAVAPDLATSMTDAIYKAAVGGNNSEIVALRSLAGINASNTEFLKQLSDNPQKVFSTLFTNLGKMQNMSNDAYMEVAEGLSSVFGVSMDAFARVDFNYLAQAISAMSTSNGSLSDNLALLASGETTTNAEQLKMQQINEYMIEEGLSYVLDNEAARAIQQNMWDEQRARELMEATYAVELKGSALGFLEGIRKTIDNILGFLNPFHFIGKVADLAGTALESKAQDADIKQLLELGKVGSGNSDALYQLTTRNKSLDVTQSLVGLMGGISLYNTTSTLRNGMRQLLDPKTLLYEKLWNGTNINNALWASLSTNASKLFNLGAGLDSNYSWGTIGKSATAALFSTSRGIPAVNGISELISTQAGMSATAQAQASATSNISAMLESMSSYFAEKGAEKASYDEWVKSATTYGISDFDKALEEVGLTSEAVRGQFSAYSTEAAAKAEQDRRIKEENFWDGTIELLTSSNTWLESIFNKQVEFFDAWVDYFVNHTAYTNAYDHTSVSAIQRAEANSSKDAVYALADALTQNNVDLLDPTMQTNVLLAEILKVVNAIMTQNNGVSGGFSLPDALSALATGVVKATPL